MEDKRDYRNEFWNWMGCIPIAIAIMILAVAVAIFIWADSGFPGMCQ